uniref:Uncharacterized protein n=1 Tax=uncultured bacterium 5G12 TaxID=1701325 RepID=A0A166H236_9BACT|nr:hypothetical protein 5G12_052 [uncultured bacterium 5G12]
MVARGDQIWLTLRLTTTGPWSGHVSIILLIAGHFTKSKTKKLRLNVTGGDDPVPYLQTGAFQRIER